MFIIINSKWKGDGLEYVEALCDSTDTKPTAGIADQSICAETDTGDVYVFHYDTQEWTIFGGED